MAFYKRAVRYLWRKRNKSCLLFFVFLLVGTMILGTSMILRATEQTEAEIQKKTRAKVICEMKKAETELTEKESSKIENLPHVQAVNRMGNHHGFLTEQNPVTWSDSEDADNRKVNIYSYDDLKNDSPFADHTYKLTAGTLFTDSKTHEAVVNADFATANGLEIGDQISIQTEDRAEGKTGRKINVTICGFFLSCNESQQEKTAAAVLRAENQIYLDQGAYEELFGGEGIYKVAVYTEQPEQLDSLAEQIQTIFQDKAEVTTSDTLFQQMKAPLEQITRVVGLMQMMTFLTGLFIVSLLLCMWMRSRQKEMAVLVSMGETKMHLFLQALLESAVLFLMAAGFACCFGRAAAGEMQKLFFSSLTPEFRLTISLEVKDVAQFLGTGGIVAVTAVFLSILPIFRSNPKDILSRMEG